MADTSGSPNTRSVERVALASPDPVARRLEELKALFPMAATDGQLDWDKLRALSGEAVASGPERYGLSWAGKSDALKALRQTTTATLRPAVAESEKWDRTGHAIIEGDNLEVLKVLQHAYHGRVKVIYIDPPYNTGGEFIYPDDYSQGLASYQRFTRQVNEEGHRLTTNLDKSGRYHSRWLTMMYPRLYLARNLLREDGVIFVSIDDHEVHNLRHLLDEIFGEECFVAQVIVQSNKRGQTYKEVAKTHEYLLVYSRNPDAALNELEKSEAALPYADSKGSFDLWELRNRNPKFGRFNRPNLFFPIYVDAAALDENGYAKISLQRSAAMDVEVFPLNSEGVEGCWRWSREKFAAADLTSATPELVARQRKDGGWNIYEKSRKTTTKVKSIWAETGFISEQGTVELGELGLGAVFEHPKPVQLVQRCLRIASGPEDIVLDFFAGSGTTAQAVFELNREDGGDRKFVLVQLPEPTGRKDFPTIAEITKERVRRVIRRLEGARANGDRAGDLGFKLFKLAPSNFSIWDPALAATEPEQLTAQWERSADHVRADADGDALLYELMLKSGLTLSSRVDRAGVAGDAVYRLDEGRLVICLSREMTRERFGALIALRPRSILCLDIGFKGNDALKMNAQLECRSHGIQFRTA